MNNQGNPFGLGNLRPGFQRDGGLLASVGGWREGQHVRFYNGKPRRMEGINQVNSTTYDDPIRKVAVGGGRNHEVYTFTASEVMVTDASGTTTDITPMGPGLLDHAVSAVSLFDETNGEAIMFFCKHLSESNNTIFYHAEGDASATDLGQTVNFGGVTGIQPYLIIYDTTGQVRWSDANDYDEFAAGDAGADIITNKPIIQGGPWRGLSVLLWAEDELWQMSYVGGAAVFNFTRVANGFDILDPNAIVQFGSRYYWPGTNCFYMFDGRLNVVPNTNNASWFFDSVDFSDVQRPRVIGVPNYSWGEIWWGFEKTTDENSRPETVLIFDVKSYEHGGTAIWWDTELEFHSGDFLSRKGAVNSNVMVFGSHDGTNYKLCRIDPEGVNDNRTGSSVHLEGYVTTGPLTNVGQGQDTWTRIYRIEPDFEDITGTITFSHTSRKYAQSTPATAVFGTSTSTTEKIDNRVQARLGQIKIGTTATGQTFSLGNPLVYMMDGDGNTGGA